MASSLSPLIQRQRSEPFAFHAGRLISVAEFLRDVSYAARRLPAADCLINACEDRYRFLVGFFAVVTAGGTNLLPPARTEEAFRRLGAEYPGAKLLTDELVLLHDAGTPAEQSSVPDPEIADAAVAAIAFTSGSTGTPQPHRKPWGALRAGARMHAERLRLGEPATLVATVPPWHMYGLEWTVLAAGHAPVTVYCGETFYPADLCRALGERHHPRVLITTPVHLRALMRSAAELPRVDTVVCATAPLERSLAEATEARLGARLLEIYGCSEAGTLAHRLPTREELWSPFPGFAFDKRGDTTFVSASFLPEPVPLADRLEIEDDGRFRLCGRLGDLVKVAGKRASLADLTARILNVPGVEDAVIVDPAAGGDSAGSRLCAFVVAPGMDPEAIRRHLALEVDPAFLPRPLKVVASLPRSPTGKLSREAVDALLESGHADAAPER